MLESGGSTSYCQVGVEIQAPLWGSLLLLGRGGSAVSSLLISPWLGGVEAPHCCFPHDLHWCRKWGMTLWFLNTGKGPDSPLCLPWSHPSREKWALALSGGSGHPGFPCGLLWYHEGGGGSHYQMTWMKVQLPKWFSLTPLMGHLLTASWGWMSGPPTGSLLTWAGLVSHCFLWCLATIQWLLCVSFLSCQAVPLLSFHLRE